MKNSKNIPDIFQANKIAWDQEVEKGRDSCIPVSAEQIEQARQGNIQITVTQSRLVPSGWLGNVHGKNILALAAGGGQQGPLLAAAGANVIVMDISPKQLEQDLKVKTEYNLPL